MSNGILQLCLMNAGVLAVLGVAAVKWRKFIRRQALHARHASEDMARRMGA